MGVWNDTYIKFCIFNGWLLIDLEQEQEGTRKGKQEMYAVEKLTNKPCKDQKTVHDQLLSLHG